MSGEPDFEFRERPESRPRLGSPRMRGVALLRHPHFRLGAVVAVAVVAGLVAWLVLRDDGGSSATQTPPPGALATSPAALAQLAKSLRHPVFWLGPERGVTYEVTQTGNGKVYVRYLPEGVDVGSDKPYLTVATYPFPNAYGAIRRKTKAKSAVTARIGHRGLALLDNAYPQSVHVAYPGVDYQVEVYDPTPARAMQLVSAGRLRAFGSLASPAATTAGTISTKPTAASLAGLEAFARRAGHPVYWAGPKAGFTYELSTTSDGRVFVRYLPAGVKPGDSRPLYTTVATYPFVGAYGALLRTATRATTIKLAHGGIGVVDAGYPKSIHLAFPGSDFQIEVYDPSPSAGRKLVASGAIAPVP